MEALKVVAQDSQKLHYEALFDEFVPLRLRSYAQPIGAGFVRLGDFSETLLELAIEPRTQRLRGITLTSVGHLDQWPAISLASESPGVPVLGTNFEESRVEDLPVQFKVAHGENGIVIFWDALDGCEAWNCGRLRSLVRQGNLVGVWCMDVTETERRLFLAASGG
jgi:hypothetical protein